MPLRWPWLSQIDRVWFNDLEGSLIWACSVCNDSSNFNQFPISEPCKKTAATRHHNFVPDVRCSAPVRSWRTYKCPWGRTKCRVVRNEAFEREAAGLWRFLWRTCICYDLGWYIARLWYMILHDMSAWYQRPTFTLLVSFDPFQIMYIILYTLYTLYIILSLLSVSVFP